MKGLKPIGLSVLLLFSVSLGMSALTVDVDSSSSSRQASTVSDVAKTVELDVSISNTGDSLAVVDVKSGVCGPDTYFRVTDAGSGCTGNRTGVVDSFGLAQSWIVCQGSSTANICTRSVSIPADSTMELEPVTVEVPVDVEDGVYDAGVVVEQSQLGVVKKESRSITVGETGVLNGLFSWVSNFVANIL